MQKRLLISLIPIAAMVEPIMSFACPRPHDNQGRPLYEILIGKLESSGPSPSGGHFLTLRPMNVKTGEVIGGPVSVSIPDKIYAAAQSLSPGTRITLFGYIGHAMSGARPGYTCMEIVGIPD